MMASMFAGTASADTPVVGVPAIPNASATAPKSLTSPREHFGFDIGDDYQLATFTQTEAYFKKLAAESDRVRFVDIGATEEGRRQPMLIVTAPANFSKLDRYKEISRRLARGEVADERAARALADEGKAVIWIDGGLHADETVGIHQLIATVWAFVSRNDPETRRILDDVVILFTHANPDGQELISSWYMRRAEPASRIMDSAPRLYQKYAGHDNNRDFFTMDLRESVNINRQLYLEWFPQVVYNHHQSAPPGTVIAGPPYRDPFNYVYDPLLVTSIDAIGAAMNNRFNAENKPGAVQRRGSVFSTWWNGGLRTTPYFHNQIGILTEVIGSPTPMKLSLLARRQLPSGDQPNPAAPQDWHFRQSIEYSLSANYSILDYASRQRDQMLFNSYLMARASIERGSRDNWTRSPSRVDAMRKAHAAETKASSTSDNPAAAAEADSSYMSEKTIAAKFFSELQPPAARDSRGYIISSNQPDFATAVRFVNTLILAGIAVEKSTAAFTVEGRTYPAGSYIVKTAQAFRPHVLDMFEPQDHPRDVAYDGGPPIPPYDSAGWTPAMLMGVNFDRIRDGFDGPFARVPYGEEQLPPAGRFDAVAPVGHVVSPSPNAGYTLVNRLHRAGVPVYRLPAGLPTREGFGPGTLFIPPSPAADAVLAKAAKGLGLEISAVNPSRDGGDRVDNAEVISVSAAKRIQLKSARIALWDRYGGSISSGWKRWLLERFEFPYTVIYPAEIDAGNLRKNYDVILLTDDSLTKLSDKAARLTPKADELSSPDDQRKLGRFSVEKSVEPLRKFIEEGGVLIAEGRATRLAAEFGLPVSDALNDPSSEKPKRLPTEKFYIPGSVLRTKIDPSQPLAWGLPAELDLYFNNDPVFTFSKTVKDAGFAPVAWFGEAPLLRSGWSLGEEKLVSQSAILAAPVKSGMLYLIGPDVTFRGQTHGTFKLLLNALDHGAIKPSAPTAELNH